MDTLLKGHFSGVYKKKIGDLYNPTMDICAEDGKVFLQFWVHSGTYKFARQLNKTDTEKLISELKQIPEKAKNLMISLEQLSF